MYLEQAPSKYFEHKKWTLAIAHNYKNIVIDYKEKIINHYSFISTFYDIIYHSKRYVGKKPPLFLIQKLELFLAYLNISLFNSDNKPLEWNDEMIRHPFLMFMVVFSVTRKVKEEIAEFFTRETAALFKSF
jgi:hypothetical protein